MTTLYKLLLYFNISSYFAFGQLIPFESQQIYKYKNLVDFSDVRLIPYTTSYQIETQLKISSIWNSVKEESQLLYFELDPIEKISTKISKNKNDIPNFKSQSAPDSKRLIYLNFYVYLEGGLIKYFLAQKNDKDAYSLNLKRGIASLFNFKSGNHDQIVNENDLLGTCSVSYISKSSTQFLKIKHFCRDWDLKAGQRYETPLSVERKSHQVMNYKLSQNLMLTQLDAIETHTANLVVKNDAGIRIESSVNLNHISSTVSDQKDASSIEKLIEELTDYQIYDIEADTDGKVSQINSNLKSLLKTYKNEMGNFEIGKLSAAYIFAKLLPVARITKTSEFVQILKSPSMAENLNQIIDLIGAAQTIDAHLSIFQVFQFENEDDFDVIERYLQALSIATRPEKKIFMNLYEQLVSKEILNTNPKLYDTLVQTLASIANKYSVTSQNMFEDEIVIKIKDYILHKLNRCEDCNCKTMYVRGLQNLKAPSTIPILIQLGLEKDRVTSVQAMKALNSFNIKLFTDKDRKLFEKIFYQIPQKFDSSTRISALDILLEMKPSKNEINYLLDYLKSNDNSFEVKRYLIEKLILMQSKCSKFKALLKDIMRTKPDIYNYHIIAQNGMSSVLERVLSDKHAFNETLLSTQEISNGVLKQGNVNYILKGGNDEISIFNLGLFTSGLSSFISSGDTDEYAEPEEVKAGMEISVQNVHFRPLVFFNGNSELMGHVFSGTASEPTAAYQATVIQQDHEEYILLQNGATIFLQIVGAKSIDLNGKVQISLWNRNAQTEIKKNSGEVIYGTIIYGTSFIKMKNEFLIESNPKISVNADVDFYSDTKLCIQLGKLKSSLKHRIENTLEILENNKILINSITINSNLPGKTLALNQKNNEMCNVI